MKISKGIKAVIVFWGVIISTTTLACIFPEAAIVAGVVVAAIGLICCWSYLIWQCVEG